MKFAIVSISDTRGLSSDASGNRLVELASELGTVSVRRIVSDESAEIVAVLAEIVRESSVDCILTTGGTGLGPRDNTPEATLAVIEREAPGVAEAIRRETAKYTPLAMLSRGVCGIAGSTLIVNLPGKTKAVEECFEVIRPVLPHAIELLQGRTAH